MPSGEPRAIVGASAAMHEVWKQVEVFAPTDISVLLTGESGTGKELFARAIHALSGRAGAPWIEVDCASLPESLIEAELFGHEKGAFTDAKDARPGKFELARGGTLFLDELGNLSLAVQAKLLRVVQEKAFRRIGGSKLIETNARIVSATNMDLAAAMERKAFRTDLFYRLAEMPIHLPALRERAGDVPLLVDHFVREYNAELSKHVHGLSDRTLTIFEHHPWPGNVRELKNVVRAGVVLADALVEPEHLPAYLPRQVLVPVAAGEAGAGRRVDPFAPGVADAFSFRIPWAPRERGMDLKTLHALMRRDLDRHVLDALRGAGLNKAQIARYLALDYKVLLEKFNQLAVD